MPKMWPVVELKSIESVPLEIFQSVAVVVLMVMAAAVAAPVRATVCVAEAALSAIEMVAI